MIDEVLMDLTHFENQEVARESLMLLFRNANQKEELADAISHLELLVSRQMVNSYDTLGKAISKLRNILDSRLTLSDAEEAVDIMDSIIQGKFSTLISYIL